MAKGGFIGYNDNGKCAFFKAKDIITLTIIFLIGVIIAEWQNYIFLLMCSIFGGICIAIYSIFLSLLYAHRYFTSLDIDTNLLKITILSMILTVVFIIGLILSNGFNLWIILLIVSGFVVLVCSVLLAIILWQKKNC